MSFTYSGAEPQPSLAWQFESSNVDSVTGLAPSSQVSPGPAQLAGSAALVTNAPTSNTAVYFPGTNGSYMLLNSTPATFDLATSNLFVECWVYFNNVPINPNFTCIVADGPTGSGGGQECWFLRFNSSRVQFTINANTPSTATYLTTLTTGQWYHIAASYDSGSSTGYVFVNGGTPSSISAVTPKTSTGASLTIGAYPSPSSAVYMNAYIRDLRVVQGGVVPTTSFTPGSAPFSYTLPSYVTGSGSVVFTLLGQFVTYAPGKYNQALMIQNPDAVNQLNTYISYPLTNSISVDSGVTISCWVQIRKTPSSSERYVYTFNRGSNNPGLYLAYNASNNFYVVLNNGTNVYIPSFPTISLNTWYNAIVVINNGTVSYYVNGTSYNAATYTPPSGVTLQTNFILGGSTNNAYEGNFLIDDLRIYNTALTAAQVQSVYSSQGAPAPNRAMPLPQLAWDFNGTMNDYVTGLAPSGSNVATLFSTGKYGQAANVYNSSNLVYNNVLYYSLTTPLSAPPYTISFWFKINTNWVSVNPNQPVTYFSSVISAQNAFAFNIRVGTGGATSYNINVYDSGGGIGVTNSGYALDTVNWVFVSAVITSSLVTCYVQKDTAALAITNIPPNTGQTFNRSIGAIGTLYGPNGGGATGTSPPFNGLIDDLRLYNTALTAAQVRSIYNQQGVPGRGYQQASPTYNAPLTGDVSMNRIYALQKLNTSYTGNIINIRRSSDNSNVNFIVDSTNSSLVNASDGISLTVWLGGSTANVVIWYDQSGNGRNLVQTTTTLQPGFDQTNGVLFRPGLYMNFPDNMTITDVTYCVGYIQRGYNASGSDQWYKQDPFIAGERGGSTNDYGLVIGGNGLFGFGSGNTDGPASTISTNGTGAYSFMSCSRNSTSGAVTLYNGIGSGINFTKNTGSLAGPSPTTMGQNTNGYIPTSLSADVSSFFMFNSVKNSEQIKQIATRFTKTVFAPNSSPFTGTPLFTQLSTSATSSAVGAFSLRAVNGSTAKAVAVQAHPVVQWPPVAMTSNTSVISGQLYGNGTYIVTASVPNNGIWVIFDNNINTYYEQATAFPYNYATGAYIGSNATTISSVSVSGEWFQVQLPTSIILRSYTLVGRQTTYWRLRNPTTFWIAGSNNGTTWSNVHQQSGINPPQEGITISVPITSNSVSYTYYRLVVNVIGNPDFIGDQRNLVNLASWNLYGDAPSYSPNAAQDFYADRLGNLLTAPVTGQTLANWLGGATGYVTTWYDQSGRGNHATQGTAANQPIITRATKGPGYSCLFNGTTNYMNFGSSTILNGTNYSVCGITRRNTSSSQKYYIGSNGAGSTRQNLSVGYFDNTTIIINEGGYATSTTVPAYSPGAEPTGYDFVMLSQTTGAYCFCWRNGTSYPGGNSGVSLPLNSAGVGIIGAVATNGSYAAYFSGEIFELIIFTASLFDLSGSSTGQLTPIPSVIQTIYNNQVGIYGS